MIEAIISWLDLTKAIAITALMLSIVNTYLAWRRGRLADEQEKRKTLGLNITLIHSFYKNDEMTGDQFYAFQLTVRNPSDSSNAISEADLAITYLTKDRIQMIAKIRANENNSYSFVHGNYNLLNIPKSISAHDTISGWIQFHIPEVMLSGNEIESLQVTLRDTHGDTTSIEPIVVPEYCDEV